MGTRASPSYLCSECGGSFSNSRVEFGTQLVWAALLRCMLRLDLVCWALPGCPLMWADTVKVATAGLCPWAWMSGDGIVGGCHRLAFGESRLLWVPSWLETIDRPGGCLGKDSHT